MKLVHILFYAPLAYVIPIFPNLGLNAGCWAHCIYQHELWPTLMGHFSFLNISLRPCLDKTLPKIYFPILRIFPQKVAIQCCLPQTPCYLSISPYFLLVGFLLYYMPLFHFRQLFKCFRNIVNWCRVAISNDKSWLLSLFCYYVVVFHPFS